MTDLDFKREKSVPCLHRFAKKMIKEKQLYIQYTYILLLASKLI
ncbi:hypothetical protein OKW21_003334 [Catalinimonas alkaloidigena]|nr:hypothetical protein [Catalinimonas alkaloidigena]